MPLLEKDEFLVSAVKFPFSMGTRHNVLKLANYSLLNSQLGPQNSPNFLPERKEHNHRQLDIMVTRLYHI